MDITGNERFKQDGGFWPLKSGRNTDDTRGLMNPAVIGIKKISLMCMINISKKNTVVV